MADELTNLAAFIWETSYNGSATMANYFGKSKRGCGYPLVDGSTCHNKQTLLL